MFNKSFLEDEVRLGFYIPATIKQAWAAQLEVLKVVDDICRECNIRYFADWGTFLGAIRHHGYIPWDDDMDIVMIRDDYDRFLEEAPKYFPDGYSIHTFRNEEGFREFHAVVVNTPSARFDKEHFDRFHGFNYLCGIDIFVLDYIYSNEGDEDKRDQETLYLISLADSILEDDLPEETIDSNLKRVKEITGVSLSSSLSKKELWIALYELADKKCAEVSSEQSDVLTQMVPWGLKKILHYRFSKYDYFNFIRVPFENTTIPVPFSYDTILFKHYGNYMCINKAGGAHDYPFFEKQKTDLEEILGKKISEYSFDETFLSKKQENNESFKHLLIEALSQLSSISLISEDDICSAQELAIDIGTMIENVKGDDHPSLQYINTYCENLYHLYNRSLNDVSLVKSSFDDMSSFINNELIKKKVAVFLPCKADFWDSFDDLYLSLSDNPDYEVCVVPIPYYYKEYDGTLSDEQYDINSYPEEIPLCPYEDFPLEFIHPDIVFIQNPYDEFNAVTSIHPDFYSSKIKQYTDNLVYIPWFKTCEISEDDFRSYKNMQYYVTVPGVINSDLVLVETEQERKMYIKKLEEWSSSNYNWGSKIKLFDNYSIKELGFSCSRKSYTSTPKTVLYYIGAGQALENSDVFIKKIESNLAIFKENEDKLALTLVIDHLLDDTIQKYKPETLSSYRNLVSSLTQTPNIRFLYDNEPLALLLSCDAYYGDASFLACEYSYKHKPVMLQSYTS